MSTTTLSGTFNPGIETFIGITRATKSRRVITLDLTNAERVFLRYGLRDIGRSIEAVYHHVDPDNHLSPWTRGQVRSHVMNIRHTLDSGSLTLLVITMLDKAIVQHAIEGNDYFVGMADDDYRLTAAQARAADALRRRVAFEIGRQIKPVPLGNGRDRLVDAQ